ncbi:baseplate J/gp47 family protein [Solimonas flava]|uniref:baseplate J/gp47 family protein n=1 Tax=Solimonas flava TaxID=415849 RepID=UPI000429F546|nr:baseplate J/gp47 family protein [Solimonas flava]
MPLSRPSLTSLQSRAQTNIATRIDGAAPTLRRGILGALLAELSGALHSLYGFLQAESIESNPYTAVRTLPQWASIWGVQRRQPTTAAGAITLTGAPGASVAADSRLQRNGVEYAIDSDGVIGGGGTVDVAVTAITAGSDGNAAAGETLTFISPLAGVQAEAIVTAGGLTGGADLEDIEDMRQRMLAEIQEPPHGGSKADYVRWARSVGTITRAWCFPTYRGPGSVRVYVINDDYAGPELASAADVSAVFDYIDSDEIKPVGLVIEDPETPGTYINGLEVLAPEAEPVDFTIDDVPDDPAARVRIEAALQELFRREAVPEGSIALTKLITTIGAGTGVDNFTLSAPVASPSAPAGKILTLGTVTWL